MAVSLKHAKTSGIADGGDAAEVQPSDWNAEHALTLATDKLLGRATAGTGAVEEVTATAFGRSLIDDTDAAAGRTTLGLGNVNNTSDANKPVSTAQAAAIAAVGGWTQIGGTTTLSGTAVQLTSLPSGYQQFVLRIVGASHNAGGARDLGVAVSSNNGSSYGSNFLFAASVNAGAVVSFTWTIDNVGATGPKFLSVGNVETVITGVIDAIRVGVIGGGSFDAGTVTLWGIK